MIKGNVELDISREELMRAIQVYFEKLYDSRVIVRGRKYRSGAWYLSIPIDLVRKYSMDKKKFKPDVHGNEVIYVESHDGLELKNFGNKRGPSYYILFPIRLPHRTRVKIFIEKERPLKFRVILPKQA